MEKLKNISNTPDPEKKERSEREIAIQELKQERDAVSAEWKELTSEESRVLSEGGDNIEKLFQIHKHEMGVINRLWRIEQQILELISE